MDCRCTYQDAEETPPEVAQHDSVVGELSGKGMESWS